MALYRKRKVSRKQRKKEYKTYKKKTKGKSRMDKDLFYRFHYGQSAEGRMNRTTLHRSRLRDAGVKESKIQRMSK